MRRVLHRRSFAPVAVFLFLQRSTNKSWQNFCCHASCELASILQLWNIRWIFYPSQIWHILIGWTMALVTRPLDDLCSWYLYFCVDQLSTNIRETGYTAMNNTLLYPVSLLINTKSQWSIQRPTEPHWMHTATLDAPTFLGLDNGHSEMQKLNHWRSTELFGNFSQIYYLPLYVHIF